jgi:putative ABC transport system permease protein
MMFLLARKNLLVYKGRFLLATAGITSAVVLMLLLMGLYAGWREDMSAYLRHVNTDLWIGQKGAWDLFSTLSLLPDQGEQMLEQEVEVAKVSSFIGRVVTCDVHGRHRHTFMVGVDDTDNGPVEVVLGSGNLHDGEIIVDQVFARKEGIHLGDTLQVAGQTLSVIGIARGGNCFLYQYSFVTLPQARRLFGLEGLVNYFLVRLVPGIDIDEAVAQIEDTEPRVSAFSKERFIANNLSLTGDNFLPILHVLEVIAVLVGTAVIGLTVYTLTVERDSEYGVLKAVGAPDRVLYWTAALQALSCGLLGWLFGVPLSWGVVVLIQYFVPEFPAASSLQHALWMLGCVVGMSLLAASVPARRIARIDPLLAFKG